MTSKQPTPHSPTPTPWIMCKPTPSGESLIAQDAKIVEDLLVTVYHGNHDKQIANAAYIVRAVNFHQVLLNVAKNLEYKRHGKPDSACEVCQTIANAEGGK